MVVLLLIVTLALAATVFEYEYYTKSASVVSSSSSGTPGGYLAATSLPVSVTNTDPLAKSLISASSTVVTFYTPTGQFIATCTTSSGACTTSGTSFSSGQSVVLSMTTTGYVTEWVPMTIPYVPKGSASLTAIPLALYQIKTNSYTTTFQIGVTSVTNGISHGWNNYKYNFSTTASQPVSVIFSFKTANEGYVDCNYNAGSGFGNYQGSGWNYDIINQVCQSAVLQISDTSNGLSVTGMPRFYSSGSTRYWWAVVPTDLGYNSPGNNGGMGYLSVLGTPGSGPSPASYDGNCQQGLSEQTIGNNLFGGVSSCSLQVQQGSVASGSTETLTFTLYFNADPTYFPSHNNLGPNAANATTPFTVVFKAH